MAPVWRDSTDKHGVPRADQVHAMVHATFVREIDDGVTPDGRTLLFIGPPHAQTDRELEILVREFPDSSRQAVVFHAMELGPKFRRFREENSR